MLAVSDFFYRPTEAKADLTNVSVYVNPWQARTDPVCPNLYLETDSPFVEPEDKLRSFVDWRENLWGSYCYTIVEPSFSEVMNFTEEKKPTPRFCTPEDLAEYKMIKIIKLFFTPPKPETFTLVDYSSPYGPRASCEYDAAEVESFEKRVHDGLANEGWRLKMFEAGSSSNTYLVEGPEKEDGSRDKIALFKPADEGLGNVDNKFGHTVNVTSSEDMHFKHINLGFTVEKQNLLAQFDYGNFACIPKGIGTEIDGKYGWLQKWESNTTPLKEKSSIENPFEIVPLNEFQKIALLDFAFGNPDRHAGNLLIRQEINGETHLVPIDWDLILSGPFPVGKPTLSAHERSREPLTAENIAYLKSLDAESVAKAIREAGLPRECALAVKLQILTLKYIALKASLSEVYAFTTPEVISYYPPKIKSTYIEIFFQASTEAKSKLSQTDLYDYLKGENIRKALYVGDEVTADEAAWYQTYQKTSEERIVTLLENHVTDLFVKGLEEGVCEQQMIQGSYEDNPAQYLSYPEDWMPPQARPVPVTDEPEPVTDKPLAFGMDEEQKLQRSWSSSCDNTKPSFSEVINLSKKDPLLSVCTAGDEE
ncbi:MAG: hypothetical protein K2Y01_06810 [Rhabdochlamydiaceae bacterium]|nr:hypothetical protein [Rhabdochlamydiaceae bacterium]